MSVQAIRVAVGLGNDDPTVVVLNGDVKDAVVVALHQKRASVGLLLPLADDPAIAVMFRDFTRDLEAEAVPGLLSEAQSKAIGNSNLVALAAPATVAILFLDANGE